MIAAIGVSACLVAVVPHNADARLASGLRRLLGIALALLTLASFGVLVSRTLELNGGAWATLWPDVRVALDVTHFGHVWLWRIPALAIAWFTWMWSRRRHDARGAWIIMLLAFAVIALTRSDTGHPADHGDFTLAVWIDWLHLLAAGTWVGSLFGMSLAVFPLLRRAHGDGPLAASVFQRLSRLCGIALAVLVACGVYSAIRQLGSVDALWTTRYGVILDVKLAIVLAMILIGAHNRYVKLPRLHAGAGNAAPEGGGSATLRACARAVLAEALLGLAVIGATATLLHAMPPVDAHSMSMAADSPATPIAGPPAPR